MREGERAKLKIKRIYAFGRPGEVEKLVFPNAYKEGDRRSKLTSKAVIYEVELVKFIVREDIDHNGSIFKQTITEPTNKHDVESPNELDDIKAVVQCYQDRGDVF
jgi:hypothetical protein